MTHRAERKYPEILTNKEVELFLEQPRCVDEKASGIMPCWSCCTPPASGYRSSSAERDGCEPDSGLHPLQQPGQGAHHPPVPRCGEGPSGLHTGHPAPGHRQRDGDGPVRQHEWRAHEPSGLLEDSERLCCQAGIKGTITPSMLRHS